MTMTDTPQFQIGDRVTIDHPKAVGVFTITEKLPKNFRVTPVGGGTPMRVSPELMRPVTDDDASDDSVGQPYVFFHGGQLVTLRGQTGVFVVLKSTPRGYSVAKLGGDAGRYYNAPTALLQPLDEAKLAAVLAATA